jgi:hypothetical protein
VPRRFPTMEVEEKASQTWAVPTFSLACASAGVLPPCCTSAQNAVLYRLLTCAAEAFRTTPSERINDRTVCLPP